MIATEPRRARRALTTAVTLALLALPLTACTSATTDAIYTPAQGVTERDSEVDVLNALIVSEEDGEGRFIAGLSNDDLEASDALVSVTGAGEDSALEVRLTKGDVELQPGGFVQLADIGPEVEGTQVLVRGEAVEAGYFVRLMLEFTNAEPIEINVPVVEPGEDFGPFMTGGPSAEVPPEGDSPDDGEGLEE